ncbi:hypothetical protein [Armatimonas rosea]|uniref:Uncharacterized protein n=1 Tax=Armatimonas rosea TaxID=685828 RepID=A0A7W9W6R0_ARMRO|nr:hypothetical protein [Armatimonas rosea]MBB6050853.1 hypothetical protein [Armatimonas rosea]
MLPFFSSPTGRKRCIAALSALAALPFIVSSLTLLVGLYRRHTSYQLARQKGLPLNQAELPHAPVPAPDQNAGPILRNLMVHQNVFTPHWVEAATRLVKSAKNLDTPQAERYKATFQEGLVKHQRLLADLETATQRPYCELELTFAPNTSLDQETLTVFRSGATLLTARALLASDPAAAFADIRRAAQLGNLVAQTPCVFAATMAHESHSIASEGYLALVERFGPSPEATKTLTSFAALPKPDFFLRGEIVHSLAVAQRLREGKLSLGSGLAPASSVVLLPLWEAQLLRFWQETYKTLRSHRTSSTALLTRLRTLEDTWYGKPSGSFLGTVRHLPNYLVARQGPPLSSIVEQTQYEAKLQRQRREEASKREKERGVSG